MAVYVPRDVLMGNPPSPLHQPVPAELVALFEQQAAQLAGGIKAYTDTQTDLDGVSGADGDIGFVLDDGVDSGVYQHNGSAWVKTAELPPGFAAVGLGAIDNSRLADMSTARIKGRTTAGTGAPEDLTAAQARAILNVEDGATADQTGAEIKAAYEMEADTNAYTDDEKSKLAGVASGATANDTDANLKSRANHTGSQAISTVTGLQTALDGKATAAQGAKADSAVQPGDDVSDLAETTTAKIMTGAERTKLAGVASGATANDTDANLLARENHTGSQAISTVTGLQTALDGKATAAQGAKADSAVQPGDVETVATATAQRPGDLAAAFGAEITGTAAAATPYTAADVVTDSDLGAAVLVDAAAHVAARVPTAIEPGRVYQARYAVKRQTDPSDPLNDAVEIGVRWLTSSQTGVAGGSGNRVIETIALEAADGVVFRLKTFALDIEGVDYTVPAEARYGRPWIRTYGDDHETLAGRADLVDITEAWNAQAVADTAVQPGDLAPVATSGDYADLSGKPDLGTAAAADTDDFATAMQGTKADSAIQPGDDVSDLAETTVAKIMTADERVKVARLLIRRLIDTDLLDEALADVRGRAEGIDNRDGMTMPISTAAGLIAAAVLLHGHADEQGNLASALGSDGTTFLSRLAVLKDIVTDGGTIASGTAAGYAFAIGDLLGGLGFGLRANGDVAFRGMVFSEGDWDTAFADAAGNVLTGVRDMLLHVPGGAALGSGSDWDWAVVDRALNAALGLRQRLLHVPGGAALGAQADWIFSLTDAEGNVGMGYRDGVWHLGAVNSLVLAKDERNLSHSDAVRFATFTGVQYPTAVYNVIVCYGQSLGEGNETWPSLSKIALPGTYMLGANVDQVAAADTYQVIGSLALNPLVAHTHNGAANLNDEAEAALAPGSHNIGEPPVIGLARGLKSSLNRAALAENSTNKVVAINPAIGGKTIEQLSKGAANTVDEVDRYSILIDGIDKAVTLAGSDSCVVPLVTWLQGEWNYADHGGSWDRDSYVAAQNALFDDIAADAISITGQSLPPLFLTYQTGAGYSRDVDSEGAPGLHVGMAQLDVALARADTAMVGPVYPYTDKGGHMDANGSRWWGHQAAKVARRIYLDGQGWQPLRPIEIEARGRWVYIHFHVPVPPLTFDLPYVVATASNYADRGFRVTTADGAAAYDITAVEIVGQTIVRLTLAETPAPDALVWYADKTVHNGNGNLRDSDPAVAIDAYEYVPERGMYASANIAALVDKPYPLHNWAVAFALPLSYSEF